MKGAACIVFYNPLDQGDIDSHLIDSGVVFFDWIQEHYPNGFGRPITLIVNGAACALEDMDFVCKNGDVISVIVTPAGPTLGPLLVAALISAVATVAASLVVYLVFGKPKKPKDQPNPDPTYSLLGGQNMVRLGEPVPVIYGRVVTYPDAAGLPYAEFKDNEQYLSQLLCLGQGEFDIYDVMIGDTPVSSLANGVVAWRAFTPAEHQETMGVIETATGVRELCTTSIEVADQEFTGGDDDPDNNWTTYNTNTTGTTITFVGSKPSSIPTGAVLSIESGPDDGTQAAATGYNAATGIADVDTALATASNVEVSTYSADYDGISAGPFVTSNPGYSGHYIEVDFVFVNGLYKLSKKGNFKARTVRWEVSAEPIDDTNAVVGAVIIKPYSYTAKTNTPQRVTRGFTVPVGRYKVTVRRLTTPPENNKTVDTFVWTGLKFILERVTTPVYGQTTLIAIKVKATNGIATDAANKIRVVATRKLRSVSQGGAFVATRSPADAFFDICTNTVYGLGRLATSVDTAQLAALETHWTPTYAKFDGIFASKITVWTALTTVLQPVLAVPIRTGKLISAASDGRKIAPMQLFSDANMVEDSFQASYTFDRPGEYAGYQIEYRDQLNFLPAYVQYPPGAVALENVTLLGCTDKNIAQQHAKLLWQKQLRLRQFCTFSTDMEGFIPQVGARVLVSTVAVSWGVSGEVISALDEYTLQLDRHVYPDDYTNPFIVLRDENGTPSAKITITSGTTPDTVVLASPIPFTIEHMLGDRRPTEWAIGDITQRVKDFTIQTVEHTGLTTTQVSAVIYDERAWQETLAFLDVPI